jgi:RNA recognition motif-containing protein
MQMIDEFKRVFPYDVFCNDRLEAITDASRALFVGDLSYFCTEEDLCTVFARYGPILTVRVRRGVTGESLMHGFIALDNSDAARRAIVELDGIEFMGRKMR